MLSEGIGQGMYRVLPILVRRRRKLGSDIHLDAAGMVRHGGAVGLQSLWLEFLEAGVL